MNKSRGEKHIASTVIIAVLCLAVIASIIAIAVFSANKRGADPLTESGTSMTTEKSISESQKTTVKKQTSVYKTTVPETNLFDYYNSRLIKESRFKSTEELTDYYLNYWDEKCRGIDAIEIIDDVDYYLDNHEILMAASVKYLTQNGYSLDDFKDEFFYLQVASLDNEEEYFSALKLSMLSNLFNMFPSDFNRFYIFKAFSPLSKEYIIIRSLNNGERIWNFGSVNCVTKRIAQFAYETSRQYYPIYEYLGIREKSKEEFKKYEVYFDILKKYSPEENSYIIYDVDGDSTSELIVCCGEIGLLNFKCDFYSIINGKAVLIGKSDNMNNTQLVIGDDGCLYRQFAHMGYETVYKYSIEDEKLKETLIKDNAEAENGEYTDFGIDVIFISVEKTYLVKTPEGI